MPDLLSPCAIVTGTSSGIGQAIALKLLSEGWHVHGIDIAPSKLSSSQFSSWMLDLTQVDELDKALDQIMSQHVPQILVHAAGVLRVGSLGSLDMGVGHFMWQLHVDVATRLANRILPLMQEARHGRMILIGSRVSSGIAGRSQYAATKAALLSLARSWAAECIAYGVTVNVVSPAATDTPMLKDPARANTTPRLPPIGRLIQPDEVAALVAYLTRPEAAAITGQDIAICGGSSVQR
ncbi:MAG: SDR family oxidoreductase [Betaproteobacteria bacterium]|jgi:3-oxoacyl-[acyl-carrier protein] reductase|nr:SDR family oxidoreductase [Betaproteobacteria bacterium]